MQYKLVNLGIVMLPPQEIREWLILTSRKINQSVKKPNILLNKKQKPHLSLIHSYVDLKDLDAIYNIIGLILKGYNPLSLTTGKLRMQLIDSLQWISVSVERSKKLQQLHIEVSDALLPFERKQRPSRQFAYEKFYPHFTLAVNVGKVILKTKPYIFTADRVVACQLGDAYSTCEKILYEWKLK